MRQIILIALAIMLCAVGCTSEPMGDMLYITFFDVGQADSFFIQCGGVSMLMDTGTESDGAEVAAQLRKMGIENIDYLMITHFDKDHVGGGEQILREFDIDTVIRPVYMKESEEVTAFSLALEGLGEAVNVITPDSLYSMNIGSAELRIHPAADEFYEKDPSNNSSLVTEIFHGENSLLFTGDVEKERIEQLLDEEFAWNYDFLKVPHHGKHEKILKEFFAKVSAEKCLITCSNKNPEEQETLEVLQQTGTKYYLTKHGAVQLQSNGKKITVNQ